MKSSVIPGVVAVLALAASAVAERSSDGVWSSLEGPLLDQYLQARAPVPPRIQASRFRLVELDEVAFQRAVGSMPFERLDLPPDRRPKGAVITLPMPDGSFARFECVESPVMEPGLAARYPGIRTYIGKGIDDPAATARFDRTPQGFHAQILSPSGAAYVDPYYDESAYIVYRKRDYLSDEPFYCAVDEALNLPTALGPGAAISGSQLRTYRLAMACTGEYAQYHGGTVQDALSAIVTTVNRVTGIYENELAIRLTLVANNDAIVFTDPVGDPYSNFNAGALLGENQSTLDSVIGDPNYDIGHVVSTGGGGLAFVGVVCEGGSKAGGETGLASPEGDVFDVDYVSHEIGHQFGGSHTFNGVNGSCSGSNRQGHSAYEPGSGSTIQAYAGICGADNLQSNSDPYFHSRSFDQMQSYVGTSGGCASLAATGNTAPTADAGADYTIPRGTPFTLTGSGSDPDGDTLTYCWEQRDLGPAAALSAPDDGSIPLFRSYNPVESPSRTLPQWTTLLADVVDNAEKLPQVARTMDFRLTVRDNRAGGGGVAADDMVVTVDATAGPFEVTYPNGGETAGGEVTVFWAVAGTAAALVNAQSVDVLYSEDGGATFDFVLADDTPNDGSETVRLPNAASANARILVRAEGNIFFDVSDADFEAFAAGLDDVYVDFDYVGIELGTPEQPYRTVGKAASVVSHEGTIWAAPGVSGETVTLDRPATVRVDGVGTVRLGDSP